MRFSEAFLDEIRARLSVSQVVSRKVNLKRKGREFAGLSPFKVEKTPSFFVNDQKGFYHCFASGEHGDIFTFVMKTEGLSFTEAVERLAQEAGLELPKSDPAQEKRIRHAASLHDALAAAAEYFETQLASSEGTRARAYLLKRGLRDETVKTFALGYAPGGRSTLKTYLMRKGFSEAQLVECGLLIKPESGGDTYDRFRDRLMIPIHDPKGRVIAFGGRALEPEVQPKYLNSPETPVFHKGSVVFNFHRARQAAHESGEAIVVEGYLDAIAVYQAGIKHVVATLGTAFTEQQIGLLWRLSSVPVICFDGDSAGEEAAYRSVDRILPQLVDGRSFRFAFLNSGKDPDDLIRGEGVTAFRDVVASAFPLSEVLWRRELRFVALDTPEARASVERRFYKLLSAIGDPIVRRHYLQSIRIRLSQLFWEHSRSSRQGVGGARTLRPGEPALERVILGMAVEYPELCERHWETFRELPMTDFNAKFRDALLEVILTVDQCLVSDIYEHLGGNYYFALNQIHGYPDPKRGLVRGHRLYERCPILRMAPPSDFVEQYLLLFIDLLALGSEEAELKVVLAEYELEISEPTEFRLLSLRRSVDRRRELIRRREHELEELAYEIRQKFRLKIPVDALKRSTQVHKQRVAA